MNNPFAEDEGVVCSFVGWWLVVVSGESPWGPLPPPGLGLRRFHLNPK